MELDHCPTCARRIGDNDDDGYEGLSGQRYCLSHMPRMSDYKEGN